MRLLLMRQRQRFVFDKAGYGAFFTPPRPICFPHEFSVFWGVSEARNYGGRQLFLDTEWPGMYSNSPEMLVISLADGATVRAFFYSKHHARFLGEDRGRWRYVGHFI
jgi:hypothetical protein